MKRFLVATAMAVSLSTVPAAGLLPMVASVVHADDWCATDPLIKVVTPQGKANVHLTVYALGTQHRPALAHEEHAVTVAPAPSGSGSLVTVTVLIPNDAFASGFPVRAAISDLPNAKGTLLASASGVSGQVMTLTFTVN